MKRHVAIGFLCGLVSLSGWGAERTTPGNRLGAGAPAAQEAERPPSSYLTFAPASKHSEEDEQRETMLKNCVSNFPKNGKVKLLTSAQRFPDTTEWTVINPSDQNVVILASIANEEVAEFYIAANTSPTFYAPAQPMKLELRAGTAWCGRQVGFADEKAQSKSFLPSLFGKSSEGETTRLTLDGFELYAYTKERYLVNKD